MKKHEPEYQGPIWKHPYMAYVFLSFALFLGLVFAAWLAWSQGWIPKR